MKFHCGGQTNQANVVRIPYIQSALIEISEQVPKPIGPGKQSDCMRMVGLPGSPGGTTMPAPSSSRRESPTSVTMQGLPQAIASPSVNGNASLALDNVAIVQAE